MSRKKQTRVTASRILLYLVVCITTLSSPVAVHAAYRMRSGFQQKPWMLLVSPIWPPQGEPEAAAFSKNCVDKLCNYFDSTSYQVVLLNPGQKPEHISNRKKDIILQTDPADFFIRGKTADTLILWLHYRTGFSYSRISIPFTHEAAKPLPSLVAQYVATTVKSEFLGVLSLTGGPHGMEMTLGGGMIIVYPPCTFLLPPGDYDIIATYPGFRSRTDPIEIFPGQTHAKRILLLPTD